ncbi:ACT domain-containing protein [Thioalkalivibrio sp. HK1]|uniref:ACT domain-containing protein n=1 Tax=Thioalkalivibrio sp. HK1 TaxID=1469245 RepID=UPI0004701470|nr:ACT domain-containing protein [Thioalkalivibrio sp. HK1]
MLPVRDLDSMIAHLSVSVRTGKYTVVSLDAGTAPSIGDGVEAVVHERQGDTVVATTQRAEREGWIGDFIASWLTIDVHSALDSVGLTAAISTALAEENIPCNVLAAFYHDHLLIPAQCEERAVAILDGLRKQAAHASKDANRSLWEGDLLADI